MDTKLDMLISRVVDGVASPADWDSLDALGAADAFVWRELAQAQRAEQLLRSAAGEAVAVANYVELPAVIAQVGEAGVRSRVGRVASWGGWAAAAAITLAFLGRGMPASPGVYPAGLGPTFANSDEAYKQYIEQGKKEGRVIGEVPDRVMVKTTQAADGKGYEIVFVRQIMERTRVDNLYQPSVDEAGDVVPVKGRMIVADNKPANKY
jgi:hypothetical protein